MRSRSPLLTCIVTALALSIFVSAAVAAPVVPLSVVNDFGVTGGAGNVADTSGYGSVNYGYNIGTTEVTNKLYCAFLNSVATTNGDQYALYNLGMWSDSARGGINRSGSGTVANPYSYTVKPGFDNKPVVYTSWYDAVRFSNWMTNQANGWGNGTETGGYTITNGAKDSGMVSIPTALQRAQWADPTHYGGPAAPDPSIYLLPTENEWYKAAYYKGANTNNLNAGYWMYPTQSNTMPTAQVPPGAANSANYKAVLGASPLSQVDAYTSAKSAYNTQGQGGNAWEWNENLLGNAAAVRGGGFDSTSGSDLASSRRALLSAAANYNDVGFRVVMVPEPSSVVMLLGACVLALIWRLRRR